MSDMYGTICSNKFKVKDIALFKEWLGNYYYGDSIEIEIDDSAINLVSFAGHEQYPTAMPRVHDGDDGIEDADLQVFSEGIASHLCVGEIFSVLAWGSERLRYVCGDRLIISQGQPAKPILEYWTSEASHEELLTIINKRD